MAQEGSKKPQSSSTAARTIWILVGSLAVIGAAVWLWSKHGKDSVAGASGISPVQSTLHLETFVLNIGGGDQRAYLRVGIDLQLDQDAKRAEELVPVAQVRDAVLGVLGEANADELLTANGKSKLKQDLLRSLQQRIPALGVKQVYFTEFLIQR